jgi:hypothetical protein
MKQSIYDTGYNTTIMLSLRRTLLRSVIQFNKLQVSLLVLIFSFIAREVKAQQAKWIWYPGGFEIVLANKVQNHRVERNTFLVFWKVDSAFILN